MARIFPTQHPLRKVRLNCQPTSNAHDVNGTREKVSKMPKFMWMDAPTVVRQGIRAVERGQLVCTNGFWNGFVYRLTRWLPESWSLRLVAGRAKDFRSTEKLKPG